MKKRLIALVAICACALCIGLVGCGGGGDASKNFVGTWELSGGTLDGEELSADDIALMKSMDFAVVIDLKDDGKATMDLMGENMEGTWKAKNATTATITFDGSDGDVTFENGKLIMQDGSDRMEFSKQ